MKHFRLLTAVAAIALTSAAAVAQRQGRVVPRYQPASPTVSPYLGLLSNQGGALPNYYALVRPLERQANINQSQTAALRQQSVQLDYARQEFGQLESRPTGTAGWFNNYPQQGAGYKQRSHYFGQWDQRRLPGAQR